MAGVVSGGGAEDNRLLCFCREQWQVVRCVSDEVGMLLCQSNDRL